MKLRWAALIVLFIFSNSFILHEVNLWWETPIRLDQNLDHYQFGVVLGGYAYYSPENDRITFRENADRMMQGLKLLQDDYIDQLIISGGSGYVLHPELKESLYIGSYLEQIEIPSRKIILESDSRNTYENAVNTAKILADEDAMNKPIVLFTSAYHMPRAIACFEKQGMTVIPYPTDPATGDRVFTPDHLLLPSAVTLAYWNRLIHEWIGYVSYKISGYI